jgi:hypothetical protein
MNYVYLRPNYLDEQGRTVHENIWTVGFFDPAGRWQPERDCSTRDAAAARVAWLNGGGGPEPQDCG